MVSVPGRPEADLNFSDLFIHAAPLLAHSITALIDGRVLGEAGGCERQGGDDGGEAHGGLVDEVGVVVEFEMMFKVC